ncbi:Zn-dependent protease with chaperone function, partial [filamentous cyanobacterium CCP5]
MHGGLILVVVVTACWLRWRWQPSDRQPWQHRWHHTLTAFCLPPLMVISAAIAVLCMGHHGSMLGMRVLPYGCW